MKFSANLGLLWSELPLLDRVYKAKEKNFDAIEFQFPYEVDANKLKSKSKNTAIEGRNLQGKVLMTYLNGQLAFRQ